MDNNRAQRIGRVESIRIHHKIDSRATTKPTDDYLQKHKEGKLTATVRELAKGCK